jgi:L-alanine-DL-glutamate epimerase-like enolase superfamily enzyme
VSNPLHRDKHSLGTIRDMALSIRAYAESWPIRVAFVIARGSRSETVVVVTEVSDGTHTGRGECVPYKRYGETVEGVLAAIRAAEVSGDRQDLRRRMAAGAARNGIDCALWDLEAKRSGERAWTLAGLPAPQPATTCFTLSLGTPEEMAQAARNAAHRPILKVKLGSEGDVARIRAVQQAAPRARLVVDANEGWTVGNLAENMRACADAGVELVEQPLPAAADELLRKIAHPIPICADESVHVAADLEKLAGKYDGVNVKLDKAGGLTEALDLVAEARRRGYRIMVGCMVSTSLAVAPAMLIAEGADFVDLDAPLLLAKDRTPSLAGPGSLLSPPERGLWG